ncbi:MAG: ATP-grasp domain-containing protein [Pseudomonadota bacterium]
MKQDMKNIGILYGKLSSQSSLDDLDTYTQVKYIKNALSKLAYHPIEIPVNLNLEKLLIKLKENKISFVFNLVESIANKDNLAAIIPALLDSMGIKYTGSKAFTFNLTTNKLLLKKLLRLNNVSTPNSVLLSDLSNDNISFEPPYILKSIYDHASKGLNDKSVFYTKNDLIKYKNKNKIILNEYFIESYIDGREFNIALLGNQKKTPTVLPCAEIQFINFPENKPKIIAYKAKWDEQSFEYINTKRNFKFEKKDYTLLKKLRNISVKCWNVFDVMGYARVDFRIDKNNNPFVLEININPCLSPDAGFVAAAAESGIDIFEIVKSIISDSI